jgi:hypothetical protein
MFDGKDEGQKNSSEHDQDLMVTSLSVFFMTKIDQRMWRFFSLPEVFRILGRVGRIWHEKAMSLLVASYSDWFEKGKEHPLTHFITAPESTVAFHLDNYACEILTLLDNMLRPPNLYPSARIIVLNPKGIRLDGFLSRFTTQLLHTKRKDDGQLEQAMVHQMDFSWNGFSSPTQAAPAVKCMNRDLSLLDFKKSLADPVAEVGSHGSSRRDLKFVFHCHNPSSGSSSRGSKFWDQKERFKLYVRDESHTDPRDSIMSFPVSLFKQYTQTSLCGHVSDYYILIARFKLLDAKSMMGVARSKFLDAFLRMAQQKG